MAQLDASGLQFFCCRLHFIPPSHIESPGDDLHPRMVRQLVSHNRCMRSLLRAVVISERASPATVRGVAWPKPELDPVINENEPCMDYIVYRFDPKV